MPLLCSANQTFKILFQTQIKYNKIGIFKLMPILCSANQTQPPSHTDQSRKKTSFSLFVELTF